MFFFSVLDIYKKRDYEKEQGCNAYTENRQINI